MVNNKSIFFFEGGGTVHCVHTGIAYSTDVLSRAGILFEFYVGISVEWFIPALM